MGIVIVTDSGQIKEVSYAAHRQGVSSAYAQFTYGGNGQSKSEAYELARKAQQQLHRENKAYGK